MRKITVCILTLILAAALSACGSLDACAGRYVKGNSYIELKADGTFTARNVLTLSGKYRLDGKKIEFDIQKLNQAKFSHKAAGTLEGDTLLGPDQVLYTRERNK